MSEKEITIYHSPDADDAFMFYGLAKKGIGYPGFVFKHAHSDIETLNQLTLKGELDVTAISVHAYSKVQNEYAILSSGASLGGENYGPKLIGKDSNILNSKKPCRIATPGAMTSSTLATKLYLKANNIQAELVDIHFEEIFDAIRDNRVDAGVVIHEGQLTHEKEGFQLIADLGAWWWSKYQLPLPLGINVAKKSFDELTKKAISSVLKSSIVCSLENRKEALEFAISYGRGLSTDDTDIFVGMYVNDFTVDLGNVGKKAIQTFLEAGYKEGFISKLETIEFI
jgi:1,4-dihydroxy-6-naphthoate synthase